MIRICFSLFFLLSFNIYASDLCFLNTDILGCEIFQSTNLFRGYTDTNSLVMPATVELDIENGRIKAVNICYPAVMSLDAVTLKINDKYGQSEIESFIGNQVMRLWRNEKQQFALQLTVTDSHIVLIYMMIQKG